MKIVKLLPAAALIAVMSAYGASYAKEDVKDAHPPTTAMPFEQDGKGGSPHGGLLEALPDDKRKILMDTMKKTHEDNKALFDQMRQLNEERDAILKADKFDQNAFLKKSDEIDAIHDKFSKIHEKAVASVASQFTPQERRVLMVMGHMMMAPHAFGGGMMMHHGDGPHDGPHAGGHDEPRNPG
jgi:uncharacterized membrane protein